MSSTTVSIALLASLFIVSTMGHSQMRCAKYDPNTGNCYAPIRNQAVSFESEAYDLTTGSTGICQSAWTNPISASYANGAGCPDYAPCPAPMGTYAPGENFYFQWLARNHAVSDQTPGNVSLYLSPAVTANQVADVTQDTFHQNKLCTAPFQSCNGQNGNFVNCSAPCSIPTATAPGTYTLWWLWKWPGHTSVYSTCADIVITSGSSSTPAPSNPTPAPVPSAPAQPSTTGANAPAAPSTTGSKPVASPKPAPTPAPSNPTPAPVPSSPAPAPTPVPSSPSGGSCAIGNMKCLTSETFAMCNNGNWGVSQSCAMGTTCSPSGAVIYCLPTSAAPAPKPSAPTQPAPSTPSAPSTTSTVASTTPSAPLSGSCTLGYQQCTGASSYQTCGNGANGPVWAAPQLCQSGLSCHPSSTANNIYCY